MVTGVPPQYNVEDYIASKNHPLKKLARSVKKRVAKTDTNRVKKYRLSSDLEEGVKDLILVLTHNSPKKRATVRSITAHPWVSKGSSDSLTGTPVVFLECGK